VWRATAAAALLAASAAGCGGHGATRAGPPPPAEWQANARGVVEQLRSDLASAAIGGTTPASAARALADVSDLYGLLVAYSDLGGCRAMVDATGAPARVVAAFDPVCTHLQRAAALFAVAARRDDAAALVRAGREVGRAQPHLVRAMLEIREAQPGARGEK
jgi:hypothetical protein